MYITDYCNNCKTEREFELDTVTFHAKTKKVEIFVVCTEKECGEKVIYTPSKAP